MTVRTGAMVEWDSAAGWSVDMLCCMRGEAKQKTTSTTKHKQMQKLAMKYQQH